MGRLKRLHRYPCRTGIFSASSLSPKTVAASAEQQQQQAQQQQQQNQQQQQRTQDSCHLPLLPVEENSDIMFKFSRYRFVELKLSEPKRMRDIIGALQKGPLKITATAWYMPIKQGASVPDGPNDNIVLRNVHTNVYISEDKCPSLVRGFLNWPVESMLRRCNTILHSSKCVVRKTMTNTNTFLYIFAK